MSDINYTSNCRPLPVERELDIDSNGLASMLLAFIARLRFAAKRFSSLLYRSDLGTNPMHGSFSWSYMFLNTMLLEKYDQNCDVSRVKDESSTGGVGPRV